MLIIRIGRKCLSKIAIHTLVITFIAAYCLLSPQLGIIFAATPTPSLPVVIDSPDPQLAGSPVNFSCPTCSGGTDNINLFICKDSSCSSCGRNTTNATTPTYSGVTGTSQHDPANTTNHLDWGYINMTIAVASGDQNANWTWDFGASITGKFIIKWYATVEGTWPGSAPNVNYSVMISNDGTTWTMVRSFILDGAGDLVDHSYTNIYWEEKTGTYRYIRANIMLPNGNSVNHAKLYVDWVRVDQEDTSNCWCSSSAVSSNPSCLYACEPPGTNNYWATTCSQNDYNCSSIIAMQTFTCGEGGISTRTGTPIPSPPVVTDSPDPQFLGLAVDFSCPTCAGSDSNKIKLYACKDSTCSGCGKSKIYAIPPIFSSVTGTSQHDPANTTDYLNWGYLNMTISGASGNQNVNWTWDFGSTITGKFDIKWYAAIEGAWTDSNPNVNYSVMVSNDGITWTMVRTFILDGVGDDVDHSYTNVYWDSIAGTYRYVRANMMLPNGNSVNHAKLYVDWVRVYKEDTSNCWCSSSAVSSNPSCVSLCRSGGTNNYWATTCSQNDYNCSSIIAVQSFTCELGVQSIISYTVYPGWNLISLNASKTYSIDQDPYNIFSKPFYYFNASTKKWEKLSWGQLEGGRGYWIYSDVSSTCTASLSGYGSVSTLLIPPLKSGYNFVGSTSSSSDITAIEGDCNIKIGPLYWDASTQKWIESTFIEPKKGYWINVDRDCQFSTG